MRDSNRALRYQLLLKLKNGSYFINGIKINYLSIVKMDYIFRINEKWKTLFRVNRKIKF